MGLTVQAATMQLLIGWAWYAEHPLSLGECPTVRLADDRQPEGTCQASSSVQIVQSFVGRLLSLPLAPPPRKSWPSSATTSTLRACWICLSHATGTTFFDAVGFQTCAEESFGCDRAFIFGGVAPPSPACRVYTQPSTSYALASASEGIQFSSRVPKRHIGGSGVSTRQVPMQESPAVQASEHLCAGLLQMLRCFLAHVIPFYVSLLLIQFMVLIRLLIHGASVSPSPLGRICGYCFLQVPPRCARSIGLSANSPPILDWKPFRDRKGRVRDKRSGPGRGFLQWCMFVCCLDLPLCVWAAPKGMHVLRDAGLTQHFVVGPGPAASHTPTHVFPGLPALEVSDFVDLGIQEPRGPPPPVHRRLEVETATQHTEPAVTTEVPFPVWIGTPGYQSLRLQLNIGVPCDIEDARDVVSRHLSTTTHPCSDRVVAVRPQPFPACAAFVNAPDWSSYSSISVVCLDLRDVRTDGEGPVIAVFVTRPTCCAELRREAGLFGTTNARIYVGTDTVPLQDHESVILASGSLVTFMRSDRCPYPANDLQYRLQFPDIWSVPARFPTQADTRETLLLLHRTGRYLLGTRPRDMTAAQAAARFIGIDSDTVDLYTTRGPELQHFQHRGIDIRGVVALVERAPGRQYVVFLDLRQVADGVRYIVLSRPYLTNAELQGMVAHKPPPSWVLTVTGGRRRRNRIDVQHCDTLVFAHLYVAPDSDQAAPSAHSSSDPDSDGSDDRASDSEGHDSEYTHRSRSPRAADRTSANGDAHPGLRHSPDLPATYPFEGFRGWLGVPARHTETDGGSAATTAAAGSPNPVGLGCPGPWKLHTAIDLEPLYTTVRQAFLSPAFSDSEAVGAADTQRYVLSTLSVQQCRLLTEPACTSIAEQRALDALHYLATELGGRWPYHRYGTPPTPALPAIVDMTDADAPAEDTQWLTMLVFVPDFSAERIEVEVTFPATVTEVAAAVHRARSQAQAVRFPWLVPALPQPDGSHGFFVGLPHWDHSLPIICVDLTALDGRIFAAAAPAYADRDTLCDIADVPAHAEIHLYVGVDSEPLAGEAFTHLVPGITVFVVPSTEVPKHHDLGQWLLHMDVWYTVPVWMPPTADGVYCLVQGHRHRKLLLDLQNPLQYRQQISRAVGAGGQRLQVVPADPRVTDVEVDGTPCRTVFAVAVHRLDVPELPQLVLVDCRALLEGWICWPVYDRSLRLDALLRDLRFSVPQGFDVALDGVPTDAVRLPVTPGQVFIADFVRPHEAQDEPQGFEAPPDIPTEHDLADNNIRPERSSATVTGLAPEPPVVRTQSPPPQDMVASQGATILQVLVASPDYLPELYELRVELDCTLPQLLTQLADCRQTADSARSPRLFPVFPQPDSRFAVCIAAPAWPSVRRVVCLDARAIDGRLFAVCAPSRVNAASVLALADLDPGSDVCVFFRDTPWPLPETDAVEVQAGDLFVLQHTSRPLFQRDSIEHLLQTPANWTQDDAFAENQEHRERVLLVTDSDPILYEVRRHRAAPFRHEVAAAVGTSAEHLILCPAYPPVRDYADNGRIVQQVLLAIETTTRGNEAAEVDVPFLLDMRPVQLGFTAARASPSGYDVAALVSRLTHFCPADFFIFVRRATTRQACGSPCFLARGEVLILEFVAVTQDSPEHTDTPPDGPQTPDSFAPDRSGLGGEVRVSHGTANARRSDDSQSGEGAAQPRTMRASTTVCLLGVTLLLVGYVQLWSLVFFLWAARCRCVVRLCALLCILPSSTAVSIRCLADGDVETFSADIIRHIPTPCRSSATGMPTVCQVSHASLSVADSPIRGDFAGSEINEDLYTLLDESAASTYEWAYLAATLLETLSSMNLSFLQCSRLHVPLQCCT